MKLISYIPFRDLQPLRLTISRQAAGFRTFPEGLFTGHIARARLAKLMKDEAEQIILSKT
jgi:hypothetical protein